MLKGSEDKAAYGEEILREGTPRTNTRQTREGCSGEDTRTGKKEGN